MEYDFRKIGFCYLSIYYYNGILSISHNISHKLWAITLPNQSVHRGTNAPRFKMALLKIIWHQFRVIKAKGIFPNLIFQNDEFSFFLWYVRIPRCSFLIFSAWKYFRRWFKFHNFQRSLAQLIVLIRLISSEFY